MTTTSKTLEIGHDYSGTMQIKEGCKAVYNGGINWTLSGMGRTDTRDSQALTDATLAYINRPSVSMGNLL